MGIKKYLLGTVAAVAVSTSASAADLIYAQITGLNGEIWNTNGADLAYAIFLQRPVGVLLNPNDNFTSTPTTAGSNPFLMAGEGVFVGSTENSSGTYNLRLVFADGAAISGNYVGSTFVRSAASTATVGGLTYSLDGFGWDRSPTNNVSAFRAVSGGDPSDYVGQFTYSATALQSPVPEPATWALMILGFGAVGGALRSRARKVKVSRSELLYT